MPPRVSQSGAAPADRWRRPMVMLCTAVLAATTLSACRLQPKGVTAFKLGGKKEFERAELAPPESAEKRRNIRLKFVDTNLFQTTATLAPGHYTIITRLSSGVQRSFPVQIEQGKDYYELSLPDASTAPPVTGPKVSAGIYLSENTAVMPDEVAVLFIGRDLIIRRVPVAGGRFETNAPGNGTYRVEVHALGAKVRSWTMNSVEVNGAKDLGLITLE